MGCLAGCSCGLGVLVVVSLVLCLSLVLSGSLRYLVQCHQPVSFPCLPGDQKQASRQHYIQDLTPGSSSIHILYEGTWKEHISVPGTRPKTFHSSDSITILLSCGVLKYRSMQGTLHWIQDNLHNLATCPTQFYNPFVIQIIASPVQFGANLQASSMEET